MTPNRREPMSTRLRARLTYANVVATLALFIALGGSSYAVSQISGSQIRNASIAGKKLKRNTIGGKRIKESRLGTVPSARNARRIGGLPLRFQLGAARGALHDQRGRERRPRARWTRRREGVPLRGRPTQLRRKEPHALHKRPSREEEAAVSLSAHLTAGPADHGRLAFHPDCPRCRAERLAGSLAADSLVSRRTHAALAAGLLAFTGAAPAATAQVPELDEQQDAAPAPGGEPPGLQPDFDPGGADTFDVELAPLPGGREAGGGEDEGLGAPVEMEPTTDTEAPVLEGAPAPPAPAAEQPPAPAPQPPITASPVESPAPPPAAVAPPATPPTPTPVAEVEAPAPRERPTKRKTPK